MPHRSPLVSATPSCPRSACSPKLAWQSLAPIPDRNGFAGSYAGTSGGGLIVAGGANFPDATPWEGGTKTWHDRVFVLEAVNGQWRHGGRMPRPAGYGGSIQLDDGVLFVAGGDAREHFRDVWLARWDGRQVSFESWPSLPGPLAMLAVARVGRAIYVAGGIDRPDATQARHVVFVLDLDDVAAGWRDIGPWPGAERMLATAGRLGDELILCGGVRLKADDQGRPIREWLCDAFAYSPHTGWRRLADLPRPVVAAPTPAVAVDGMLLVIGGDDGTQAAIPPGDHRGFPRGVLAYDPAADRWRAAGETAAALVTTTLALWNGYMVIPGGEQRPGVRSTEVWAARAVSE